MRTFQLRLAAANEDVVSDTFVYRSPLTRVSRALHAADEQNSAERRRPCTKQQHHQHVREAELEHVA